MLASTNALRAKCIISIHRSQHGIAWREIAASYLLLAVFTLMSATAFAQQGNISIDSFRVLNTTPEFADIEIVGSNDGSMGQLCLGAIVKSRDGTVRSGGFPPFVAPADKQFHLLARVLRPEGSGIQQTNILMVMVYPCGKEIVQRRKFDWPYVWPEKRPSGENEGRQLSVAHPWRAFHENLEEEDFAALDGLMTKWNNPRERDDNGEWKLDSFRSVFVNFSSQGRDWKGDLQRIKKWRELNPKSVGAAIAESKYWAAYAWHIRGNETRINDDPVAIRVFGERMQRAEQVLKDAKDFGADNPLWYEAYLDIAVATKRDDKFIEALFNEAIRKHPYFQPLYLDMAKHWAPRLGDGADWKNVDEVIKQAASNTADMDGISNYALLYAQISDLQKFEFDLFEDSYVLWPKMRDAFEELVKRYPSADNLNEFAAFACRAGDKSAFLNIRPKIINRIVPNKWPGNYSYDLCDHRFLQNS